MTVEDEKGYEIAGKYLRKKYGDDYVDFLETEGQSYLDGLAEGKPKWHDLRKNPDDLPKESGGYLILHEDNTGFTHYCVRDFHHGYFECTNTIIAWCELPKFEE